jgi:hypothetical protein
MNKTSERGFIVRMELSSYLPNLWKLPKATIATHSNSRYLRHSCPPCWSFKSRFFPGLTTVMTNITHKNSPAQSKALFHISDSIQLSSPDQASTRRHVRKDHMYATKDDETEAAEHLFVVASLTAFLSLCSISLLVLFSHLLPSTCLILYIYRLTLLT